MSKKIIQISSVFLLIGTSLFSFSARAMENLDSMDQKTLLKIETLKFKDKGTYPIRGDNESQLEKCRYFSGELNSCRYGSNCKFSHDNFYQKLDMPKQQCKYFNGEANSCKFGNNCRFSHNEAKHDELTKFLMELKQCNADNQAYKKKNQQTQKRKEIPQEYREIKQRVAERKKEEYEERQRDRQERYEAWPISRGIIRIPERSETEFQRMMAQERGEMNAYTPLENACKMYEAEMKNGRTSGFEYHLRAACGSWDDQ